MYSTPWAAITSYLLTTSDTSAALAAGYLVNCRVYLDANKDGVRGVDEYSELVQFGTNVLGFNITVPVNHTQVICSKIKHMACGLSLTC